MRIRKRKMLFPQSSLPDPLVQFSLPHSQPNKTAHIHLHHQPSLSDHRQQQQEQQDFLMQKDEKAIDGNKNESKDAKNESIYGAKNVARIQPDPADSSSLGKAFPLSKKRRGNEDIVNKSAKSKMKTKMEKKIMKVQPNGDNASTDGEAAKDGAKKKANRGCVLVEGSRCSRVNGRGWRCSQPTLVGYSLCEHHLGKGRLRSMNTVKGRFLIGSSTMQESAEPLTSSIAGNTPKTDNNNNEDEDDEPLMVTKKKIKLGMVKAKSMSSLLGKTDHGAVEAQNGNK